MKKIYGVLLIVCVISFAIASNYASSVDGHRDWRGTVFDLRSLEMAVMIFKLDNGRVPSQEEGLDILVSQSNNSILPHWKKYINRLPKDLWGHSYIYNEDAAVESGFTIYSAGPDGEDNQGGGDDVVLWEKDYQCEHYSSCSTTMERVGDAFLSIAFIGLLLMLAALFAQLSRFCYRKAVGK